MATIIANEKEIEVKDNSKITPVCEKLGVVFGCYSGFYGSCKINVLEGAENLNKLTKKEMDMDNNQRLACQCKIKQGKIKIEF
ncbi:MAG: hypothetical protein MAG795_00717 [Candidatus Woesearchaeota archaeon]|nr:hypothetical protein [Candidatus Woesearchaeota archaeon]